MCVHIAKKLGAEGAKKHSLTDRMEFRKKSSCRHPDKIAMRKTAAFFSIEKI